MMGGEAPTSDVMPQCERAKPVTEKSFDYFDAGLRGTRTPDTESLMEYVRMDPTKGEPIDHWASNSGPYPSCIIDALWSTLRVR